MAENFNAKVEKKPFKLDTKILLYITIGLVTFNLFISYYLLVTYQSLVKPTLPLDIQVKQTIKEKHDLTKMVDKIKNVANGKNLDEE